MKSTIFTVVAVLLTVFTTLVVSTEADDNTTSSTVTPSETSQTIVSATSEPTTQASTSATSEPTTQASTSSTSETTTQVSTSPTSETSVSTNSEIHTEATVVPTTENSIRILLTSDIEYNIFPVHKDNHSLCFDINTDEEQTAADCVGGLSRLVNYVDKNGEQVHLVMDAGNVAGQTYFPQLKFNPLTQALKRLNFTAMAVDAELLTYGIDAMQYGFLSDLGAVALAANLDLGAAAVATNLDLSLGLAEVHESRTITWQDRCDIAVIGVVSRNRIEEMSVHGVNASDEVVAVQQEMEKRANDSNTGKLITIVIGNIAKNVTEAIANIQGVDVVIFSGAKVSDPDMNVSSLASVTQQGDAFIVTLLHSDQFPFVLGHLELSLAPGSCNVSSVQLEPVDYSAYNRTDDEAVKQLEAQGATRLYQVTSGSLAASTASVPSAGCNAGECALGNLVTDAMVSQLMVQVQGSPRLAIYPGRSFRNNSHLSAEVTGTAVDAVFENDEFLYAVNLSAAQLKGMLEESVGSGDSSSFLQISALMSVQFNLEQPMGSRVVSVQVVPDGSVSFSPVNLKDDSAMYSVAVPASFLWNNSVLQNASYTFYLFSVGEAVKAHLLRAGVLVVAPAGSRVTYLTNAPTTTLAPPTSSPAVATCPDSTAVTVFITLMVMAACGAAAVLFWLYAMPRIRFFRSRRDSSLPLVLR